MRELVYAMAMMLLTGNAAASGVVVKEATCEEPVKTQFVDGAAALLAAPLIESLVMAIGDRLVTASGKTKPNFTAQGNARTYFYGLSGRKVETGERIDKSPHADNDKQIFNSAIACLEASIPDKSFLLKLKLEFSKDQSAFAVIPTGISYPQPIGPAKKVESLSATIDFIGTDGKAFASAVLPIDAPPKTATKRNQKNSEKASLEIAGSGWLAPLTLNPDLVGVLNSLNTLAAREAVLPALIAAEQDPVKKEALQQEAIRVVAERERLGKRLVLHGPVTIKVTLVETRDINEFLAAVGEAMGGKKAELAKLGTDALFPTPTTDAEKVTKTNAIGTYWKKRYEFDELARVNAAVQADPASSPEARSKARVAAVSAQYEALSAAISAGIVIPANDYLRTYTP
jgi:hypothetical protein